MTTHIPFLSYELASPTAIARRLGMPAGISVAVLALVGFGLGLSTPPRSGPFCSGPCIVYPYLDAAQFFPRDYLWMIPASLLGPAFLLVLTCLHFVVPFRSRPLTLLALVASSIATSLLMPAYLMQFLVVQPSLLKQQLEGVALLTQYNPHGLFFVLEDLGYLGFAAAFVFAGLALPRTLRSSAALFWILEGAAVLVFLSFMALAVHVGVEMAVAFEVTVIAIEWLALIPAGILFARFFRHTAQELGA